MNVEKNQFLRIKKPFFIALVLLALTATLRFPTLFNDFYDADELAAIVQAQEYLAGGIPGVDFHESKGPLYHAIFKFSYKIFPHNGWVLVHAITTIIVWFTAIAIFMAGKAIGGDLVGILASCMYSIFISSFNRHFMATNGEIVFNLPVAWGFYFFIVHLQRRARYFFLFWSALMALVAFFVKFHGIVWALFLFFYFLIYQPHWQHRFTKKYIAGLALCAMLIIIALTLDYATKNLIATTLITNISQKLYYAIVKGINPVIFFAKYFHRQGLLILWHFAAWIPAIILTVRFVKNKFRFSTLEQSTALVFFFITYLLVFAGGSRLYHHYFMAAYPALTIVAALGIVEVRNSLIEKIRSNLKLYLAMPALFFLLWNTKDVVIKHFFPEAFYHEPKILYWGRAAFIGHFQDYLLPENAYRNVAEYIKNTTHSNEKIFVWGDGPYLYYFSKRKMGIYHLWPKTTVIRLHELYKKGDDRSITEAHAIEQHFIDALEKKKPALFVDTSPSGYTGFVYPPTPKIKNYLDQHYRYCTTIDNMKIYRRNSCEERKDDTKVSQAR